jgi:hypothetical protein
MKFKIQLRNISARDFDVRFLITGMGPDFNALA